MEKLRNIVCLAFLLCCSLTGAARKLVWVLDAGHGGYDVGCEGLRSCEKDITLKVVLELKRLIESNMKDVTVVLTRSDDRFVSLQRRCEIANNKNADLFLSVHVNAAPDNHTIRGTETYYGPRGGTDDKTLESLRRKNINKSELLARQIQRYYKVIGRPNGRGVKRERYYVVLHTRMPAVLTEIGFISTPSDEGFMNSAIGINSTAQSIYCGLADYKRNVSDDLVNTTLSQLRNTGTTKQPMLSLPNTSLAVAPPEPEKEESASHQENETPVLAQAQEADTKATAGTTSTTAAATVEDVAMAVPEDTPQGANAPVADNANTGHDGPELEPEPEFKAEELKFMIQVFAVSKPVTPKDPRLQGLDPIECQQVGDRYKVYYGHTGDYVEARQTLAKVRELFPDAFLVAYLGDRQISTADAAELYVKNK